MTSQQNHPITPNPEQIYLWQNDWRLGSYEPGITATIYVATQAAQWGADQELEACCEWVSAISGKYGPRLRIARRPKSPNKKQRGLTALEATNLKKDDPLLYQEILNAIEELPND